MTTKQRVVRTFDGTGVRGGQETRTGRGEAPIVRGGEDWSVSTLHAPGATEIASPRRTSGIPAEDGREQAGHRGGEKRRRIIAVGGGKGGVGKSLIAANLGVHLAQSGKQVVMVDADLGGANLHTCLGVAPPQRTLSDFINRKFEDLADVVCETTVPRLGLISGALDLLGVADPKHMQKQRLLQEITRLNADAVIIDLGGGTGFNILDFFLIAEHGILGVVPEPTSIENAYRFIKAVYYRRLKYLEMAWNLRPLIDEAATGKASRGLLTPAQLVAYVEARDPDAGALLRSELQRYPIELVVNQTRTAEEEQLGQAVSAACRRYFGVAVRFLASIPYDDAVWRAVRRRRPVVLEEPQALASEAIRRMAMALGFGES